MTRRRALAAVAALAALSSVLVQVTTGSAQADAPSPVVLPALPDGAIVAKLFPDGDRIYAELSMSATSDLPVYWTPADGTGAWQPAVDPETQEPVVDVDTMRDGVMVMAPAGGCTGWRVITATRAWDVPGCATAVAVGVGGRLVSVDRFDQGVAGWEVYDAEAGPAAGVLTAGTGLIRMAGTWVWTMDPTHSSVITGQDTSGALPDRSVDLRDACPLPYQVGQIAGDPSTGNGAMAFTCQGGFVLPLDGTSGPVAFSGQIRDLGPGFLYSSQGVFGATSRLDVEDLSASLDSTRYDLPGNKTAVSDFGPAEVVYQYNRVVSVLTLPAPGAMPTPASDTTSPMVTSTGGSPAAIRLSRPDSPVTFNWAAADDEAAAPTYEVQVRQSVAAPGEHGWRSLPGLQGTFATTTVFDELNQSRDCFRVRATDRVGNVSAWSTPRCTWVDAFRPDMNDGRDDPGLTRVLNAVGPHRVTGRFSGDDDSAVASYDVERRVAVAGHDLGRWETPRGWRHVRGHRVSKMMRPGSEICFRARATDVAGRRSHWGDKNCTVLPYDDTAWSARGARSRPSQGAFGGTTTRLSTADAFVAHSHVVGRTLWIRARSDRDDVCPHVWWGGREVMAHICGEDAAGGHGYAWFSVTLPHLHRGAVRVGRNIYSSWTEVDAIAVGH